MLNLALVGCGGMGCRHIRGLKKLSAIGAQRFRLVAVCDLVPDNAARAADLAEDTLGERPRIFSDADEMYRAIDEIDAAIITTAPDLHASVGIAAMEHGTHVMVEKPLALTVAQGRSLIESARRNGLKLAVAENYRRDPVNRLAKAVIDAGAIGQTYLAVQSSSGSGEKVIITPWRHLRRSGGIVVDMGIHYADLLEYFMGPINSVFGFNAVIDKARMDSEGQWHDVDAEDLSVGVTRFASGAIGSWLINLAGRGESGFQRMMYGSQGTVSIPPDRTGRELSLMVRANGKDFPVSPQEQLSLVQDFSLDDTTARLFGGDRLASYDLPFADIDANLLAIEQADFGDSILEDRPPEVDGECALRSLAISYGFLESERAGRALDVEDLVENRFSPYQASIQQPSVGGSL